MINFFVLEDIKTFIYYALFFKDKIMQFPTWIDLKGQDSVPDTVHHVVSFVGFLYEIS